MFLHLEACANIAVLLCSRWENALDADCFLAAAMAEPGADVPQVNISRGAGLEPET